MIDEESIRENFLSEVFSFDYELFTEASEVISVPGGLVYSVEPGKKMPDGLWSYSFSSRQIRKIKEYCHNSTDDLYFEAIKLQCSSENGAMHVYPLQGNYTTIQWAFNKNLIDTVIDLLKSSCHIEDRHGVYGILCDSIQCNLDSRILSEAIKHGFDVYMTCEEGISIIHWAIMNGNFTALSVMLECGVDVLKGFEDEALNFCIDCGVEEFYYAILSFPARSTARDVLRELLG